MKKVIESIKNYWKGLTKLFKDDTVSYYYKMDGKNDPFKVCPVDDPKCPNECGCKQTSDFKYEDIEPSSPFIETHDSYTPPTTPACPAIIEGREVRGGVLPTATTVKPQITVVAQKPTTPIRANPSKSDLQKMTKLSLQVMAHDEGIVCTGKEKKHEIISKLVKHFSL